MSASDPLMAELAEKPWSYDFFFALRTLQSRFPNHPRIGDSMSPAQDPVRFAQTPALDFAPATIEAFDRREGEGAAPVLYSRHFGVFGPNGPLPLCLTEYARDRIMHHGDRTFAAFCNTFHHRLLSFFFRAWANARKTVDLDRPVDSHWWNYTGSLVGVGMESLQRRDSIPDQAKLYYAGRLAQQSRNAEGLEAIIGEFFGVKTEVRTFIGRWVDLPPGSECRLGASPATGSLGVNTIVGARFWHGQYAFRIRLGPMKLDDYQRLLPTGGSFQRLCDWVRLYTGEQYAWDVQLVLDRSEVPTLQLGKSGRLGWQSWLKTRSFEVDAEDLILQPPGSN